MAAVMSSAANPVSNGLYARRGMYPLMPVLYLNGRLPARNASTSLGSLQPRRWVTRTSTTCAPSTRP